MGSSGAGVEQAATEVRPWPNKDKHGRYDLRIDLSGVERGRGAYWHDVLWFYFHNHGRFPSFAAFRECLQKSGGVRVDHVGGCPAVTDVRRLELVGAVASAGQGASRKRLYRVQGEQVLAKQRLSKVVLNRPARRSS